MKSLNFGSKEDWIGTANQIIRTSAIIALGSGLAGGVNGLVDLLFMLKIIPAKFVFNFYNVTLSIMLTAIFTAFIAFLARDFITGYYKVEEEENKIIRKKEMKKMKYRELWKLPVGKILYIWLVGAIIYAIYLMTTDNIVIRLSLILYGIALAPVPLWITGGYFIKKKMEETGEFKHHRIFEYMFFLFLFMASFGGTFFSVYMQRQSHLEQLFFTGLAIMSFTINAIIAGLFHYVYGFHD